MTAESSGYRLYDGEQFDKRFPGEIPVAREAEFK